MPGQVPGQVPGRNEARNAAGVTMPWLLGSPQTAGPMWGQVLAADGRADAGPGAGPE